MNYKYGIYITRVKNYQSSSTKIGISRNPERRSKAKNVKSFGYGESYGKPDIFFVEKEAAKKIEDLVKEFFFRFRVKGDVITKELFEGRVHENIRWAVIQSLAHPEGMRETCWRAANGVLSMSSPLKKSFFDSELHDQTDGLLLIGKINDTLKSRGTPPLPPSLRLGSGCASSIIVSDTPDHIELSHIFNFDIDVDVDGGTSSWISTDYRGIKGAIFTPSEEIDIDRLLAQPMKSAGIFGYSVNFTEKYHKKSGYESTKVTNASGKELPPEIERELLNAVLQWPGTHCAQHYCT
ncbi:GIY-YIG nuclease family protein [Rhodobacteraceae bacterium R_SAG2]|nr:GIY-YIG nuclease family protein [Rhodobacteraceae bacterium R_SAG2]